MATISCLLKAFKILSYSVPFGVKAEGFSQPLSPFVKTKQNKNADGRFLARCAYGLESVSLSLKKVPVSQVPDSRLYSLVALSFFTKGLRNGIFPAISKMSQSSAIAVLQCELVSPEEMQERRTYLPLSSYQTAATPYVQT